MKKLPKFLAATCAAVALSASLAFAADAPGQPAPQPPFGPHASHAQRGQMGPHGMALAALTPEKPALVRTLMDEHRAALFPLHQNLYAKRAELEALNASGAGVTSKTKAVIRDIADLNAKMLAADAAFRARLFKETGLRVPVMGHGMMGGMMGGMGGGKCAMMEKMMGGQMGGQMGAMMHGAPAAYPAAGQPAPAAPAAPAPDHDAHN